ncbi:hypothetical protein JAAARDRAFT_36008 [Jaapia argillacea MUCL 33604]|uniref:Uncharacterized protein n=1 Tax=Jaapia argillacea MUCL 33604 TaxID=933084 RepID=A0A067PP16_9AGAM|nr:hypothetical protein JAAARDRAFT_36008 [Jaapia argillacea MUCL 33604]
MAKTLIRDCDYRIPSTLKKTIQDYSVAYILSPTVSSYRGADGPSAVLDAMRELNIAGLPPAKETGRCDVILAAIAKAQTDCRCSVKSKHTLSLKPGVWRAGLLRWIAMHQGWLVANRKARDEEKRDGDEFPAASGD